MSDSSKFCNQCGIRLKCKKCDSLLNKNDKFCGECGAEVVETKTTQAPNTVSFHKKGDEIKYEVGLSNEVGKEGIKSLIESITQTSYHPIIDLPLNNEVKGIDIKTSEQEDEDTKTPFVASGSKEEIIAEQAGDNSEINYPHIDDLLFKRKYTEIEWILVFAFYEGKYGEATFTYELVRNAYLGKRKNNSRVKNFSQNWNGLRKTYFDTVSEGVFKIEYDKLQMVSDFIKGNAQGIIKGVYEGSKSSHSSKVKEKPEGATSGKGQRTVKQISTEDFDVVGNSEKPSLKDVYEKFKPENNKEIFGMIAYYICVLNNEERFSAGNIDFAYRLLKINRKNNLIQLVNNVKNETRWFDGIESGVWKLTRLGTVELESLYQI